MNPSAAVGNAADGLGRFRVHWADGRDPTEVRVTSRALVECERRWPGVKPDGADRYPPNEGVHYMVFIASGSPHGDFEKWLDEVLSVEVVEAETAVPPTTPVAGVD